MSSRERVEQDMKRTHRVRGGGDRAGRSAPGPGPHSPARRRGCLAGPRSWCSVLQREDSPSPSPPFCGSSLGGRERADSFPGSRVGQRQRGVRPHGLPPGCRRPGAGQGFLPWGWHGTLRCRGRPPRPAWETPAAAPRYRNRPQTPRHSSDLSVTPGTALPLALGSSPRPSPLADRPQARAALLAQSPHLSHGYNGAHPLELV